MNKDKDGFTTASAKEISQMLSIFESKGNRHATEVLHNLNVYMARETERLKRMMKFGGQFDENEFWDRQRALVKWWRDVEDLDHYPCTNREEWK